MRTCMDNLVTYWGYDPEIQAHLSRGVQSRGSNDLGGVVARDFPRDAVIKNQQVTLHIRLGVSAEGKPTTCNIEDQFEQADFSALCADLLDNTRFDPALDAQGNPVASFYVRQVTYLPH